MLGGPIQNLLLIAAGVYLVKQFGNQAEANKRSDEIVAKPLPVPPGQTAPPKPTITTAEAQAIAQKQLIAMNQYGTDESLLFNSLKGLNGADLRLVYKAFGLKRYSDRLGVLERIPVFGTMLDLFGWYTHELDTTELGSMRVIWYKAGVTF